MQRGDMALKSIATAMSDLFATSFKQSTGLPQ
jgi:hypothetical protein